MNDIHQLIASGQTEEALSKLSKFHPDVILLQARYNQGKKQYNMGLIEYKEWQRVQAQINYAALEIAGKLPVLVVNNVNYIYMNFVIQQDTPGNELALFNRIFRSLEQMNEDRNWPLDEIEVAVKTFDKHIGLPDLVSAFEDFGKSEYVRNTEAYQTKIRREFVGQLLKYKDDFLSFIREIVTTRQAETDWKEAWELVQETPTKERWDNTVMLIDQRLQAAIFSDAQRLKWAEVSADAQFEKNIFWRANFMRVLPDIKRWINENMH